jgi:large subunit ribosomal protein L10
MTNTKISANRKKKEALVAELTEKVTRSKSIVFTDYQGLTHHQLERVKKTVKKLEAEYVATKNTLLKIALKDKIDTAKKDQFTGSTATLFIYNDIAAPLKELAAIIKELSLPKIKFGIFEGNIISENEVKKISNLPPLPVLRAQLLGQMQSPIQGLHRALNWNTQKLVLTLNAIKDKKS